MEASGEFRRNRGAAHRQGAARVHRGYPGSDVRRLAVESWVAEMLSLGRLAPSAKTSQRSRLARLWRQRARPACHRACDSVLQWALVNGAPLERIRPPVTVDRP